MGLDLDANPPAVNLLERSFHRHDLLTSMIPPFPTIPQVRHHHELYDGLYSDEGELFCQSERVISRQANRY